MKKIIVIGMMGSGKSTFANKLGKKINRKIIHLDKEFHLPNWEDKFTEEEWIEFLKRLLKQKEWIIDGNYKSTLDLRLKAADTIIFFDFPKWLCLFRVIKRSFNKKQPFDKPEGMREKISFGLIKLIITYPSKKIREKLKKYKKDKKVFIVKNNSDIENLLQNLAKRKQPLN